MAVPRWDRRFFSTTRGRIVALLRRASATVDELAGSLGLTDNAVRAQLVTLERDGLVAAGEARRGVSKPAIAYALTSEAERLFARGYAPLLDALLAELGEEREPGGMESTLRAAGRRLAAGADAAGPIEARLATAVGVLNGLGGCAEWQIDDGRAIIRGYGCPLAEVTARHPEVCVLAEELVGAVIGVPMQERCERGGHPRCHFTGPLPTADP